jgi:hypothetical protein
LLLQFNTSLREMARSPHGKRSRTFPRPIAALLVAGSALFGAAPSRAVLNYHIFQEGADVTVKATGSLNLPQSLGTATSCFVEAISSTMGSAPSGLLCSDLAASSQYKLSPGTTPSFPFAGLYSATTTTGTTPTHLFVGTHYVSLFGFGIFGIVPTYGSGDPIDFSLTFASLSLSDMGFSTPGLYDSWTLLPRSASDPYTANDTINWIVGAPAGAAVPGPVPLIGVAAALGWSRRLRQRMGVVRGNPGQRLDSRAIGAPAFGVACIETWASVHGVAWIWTIFCCPMRRQKPPLFQFTSPTPRCNPGRHRSAPRR